MKSSNRRQDPERESQAADEISAIRKPHDQPGRNRVADFEKQEEQREFEPNMKEWARYIEERECPRNPGDAELER